ncbi:hypothetical protein HNY73_015537 [Argiope bruennichi]|uniref:Uncharacterized protein n=1 Tax=Argiope bruennichi TaxID=94029 RepID=A0A8T0ESC7_ARGBR|nr:hypothetical protein HNY73_015537 [Argiope bruennichi]
MLWFRNNNIRKDLRILTIEEFIKKLSTAFFQRIDKMDNITIKSLPRRRYLNSISDPNSKIIVMEITERAKLSLINYQDYIYEQ